MKLRNKLTVLLLIAVIFLTGCVWNDPVEELLSPPRLTDEQMEIYRALTNSKGSVILKYPKSGEYRSAFVIRESNPRRVMVFHAHSGTTGITEPTVWLTFLEQRDGRWECTHDLAFFATDIERVDFSALGDSDSENIIVSYSVMNQLEKDISIITFDEEGAPLFTRIEQCIYYEINDFTQYGNSLFYIKQDRGERTSQGRFITRYEGSLIYAGRVSLNPDATEYVKVSEGLINQDRPAMFLEYIRGDNTGNTDVISIQGNRLVNSVFSGDEERRAENLSLLEKRPNAFTFHVFSQDIDGDGITNVGGNAAFPGYDEINIHERVRAVIWYSIVRTNRLEQLYYSYYSINNDYVFFFPDEWINNVTVTVNPDGHEVTFWEYEQGFESVHDVKTELLRILTVPAGEAVPAGYALFDNGSNDNFGYYVMVFDESLLQEELSERLRIL